MKCDLIQPDLLDYSRGRLTGREAELIQAHLKTCAQCSALLEQEAAFAERLSAVPDEQPANDVWTLVRARTRPRRLWLADRLVQVLSSNLRRLSVASIAVAIALIAILMLGPVDKRQPASIERPADVVVKWSDDPLGDHTDAVVKLIDEM